MEQPGIPTPILIAAIGFVMLVGLLLFSLASSYRRFHVEGGGLNRRVAEPRPDVPATRAPAGSMAERRQNIEELLERKERESRDS